ncbi:type II toxin-antitoxin system RelE/ParE family toxin [Vibrio sp. SCSIO 43137]|uniref:type II toxin-antitoxin system RelE/ParE family toxin n=1 Tax=Vibrio sp. SCSIO 43137 TaxID=3021011 RepID=UPI002307A3D7|nr:type II toxin-antitoxin system RelE/ParE family toxin [Vibrio sp. SCSIO 43137]WCE31047.1 type II toxin-antitoxin system RelE/ParE family toxin [Vibrio sp. SCSIO 43137]
MNQKKPVNIFTTASFDKTIDNSITYLSQWNEELNVITGVESALEKFESQVLSQPLSYSRCPELMELGVNSVRNAHISEFRLLYEVEDGENEITVNLLLFLRTKQSIEKQLIEYCLYQ